MTERRSLQGAAKGIQYIYSYRCGDYFEFPWTDGAKLPMIQFSGGLFGGNSGGALYDSRGRLIGVPAAGIPSATFIGFAVPVEVVKLFLKDSCFASVFDDAADDKKCRAEKEARKKKD